MLNKLLIPTTVACPNLKTKSGMNTTLLAPAPCVCPKEVDYLSNILSSGPKYLIAVGSIWKILTYLSIGFVFAWSNIEEPDFQEFCDIFLQLQDLKLHAQQLRNTVQKLIHAEDSLSSNYTCLSCLRVFDQPVTCVPCGHTFCQTCLSQNQVSTMYHFPQN